MDDREMPLCELIELAKTDNGACALLAGTLRIHTTWLTTQVRCAKFIQRLQHYRNHGDDRMAAWRTAIVAVAIAIGKEGK